jgi:hypothetical protein
MTLRALLAISLITLTATVSAQRAPQTVPKIGTPGKDVLWVPSPNAMTDGMLEMAKVTPRDVVMDLGSGDGRVVLAAAKRGARGIGVEFNGDLVEVSKRNAAAAHLSDKTTFIQADIFTLSKADLSPATVILLFLRTDLNLRLRPKLLDLKPGTRIVSNTFTMGDWEPDDIALIGGDCVDLCSALLWIVPATARGTWHTPQGDLVLLQQFQKLTGSLKTAGGTVPIKDGRLRADQLTMTIGAAQYSGKVSASTIEGTVREGKTEKKWTATRPQ